MRRVLGVVVWGLVGCSSGASTAPAKVNGAFGGQWSAVTIDGAPLPFNYAIGAATVRITQRKIDIYDFAAAGFRDDAATMTASGIVTDLNGTSLVDVSIAGQTLTASRMSTFTGYMPPTQQYTLNADGTLQTTRDGHVEVYRK